MELSKRLQAVSDMISDGKVVADIGTDHGYIPIHLIQSGKCQKVYAMDVNEGPYNKARQHIAGYKLSDKIIARLSNGMRALEPGEVNAIIIAGMGGGLVTMILEQDRRLWDSIDEFVLQPQSELHKVREYILANGLKIVEEDMIYEDGKYYPMMKVIKGEDNAYSTAELYYGRHLIRNKSKVLYDYLQKEVMLKEDIIVKLEQQAKNLLDSDTQKDKIVAIKDRILEIQEELVIINEVCRCM